MKNLTADIIREQRFQYYSASYRSATLILVWFRCRLFQYPYPWRTSGLIPPNHPFDEGGTCDPSFVPRRMSTLHPLRRMASSGARQEKQV